MTVSGFVENPRIGAQQDIQSLRRVGLGLSHRHQLRQVATDLVFTLRRVAPVVGPCPHRRTIRGSWMPRWSRRGWPRRVARRVWGVTGCQGRGEDSGGGCDDLLCRAAGVRGDGVGTLDAALGRSRECRQRRVSRPGGEGEQGFREVGSVGAASGVVVGEHLDQSSGSVSQDTSAQPMRDGPRSLEGQLYRHCRPGPGEGWSGAVERMVCRVAGPSIQYALDVRQCSTP